MKISRTKSDAHCYASTMATVYNCSLANVSDISRQAKRVNSGVRPTVLYRETETGERRLSGLETPASSLASASLTIEVVRSWWVYSRKLCGRVDPLFRGRRYYVREAISIRNSTLDVMEVMNATGPTRNAADFSQSVRRANGREGNALAAGMSLRISTCMTAPKAFRTPTWPDRNALSANCARIS